jgi:hypothetical protein
LRRGSRTVHVREGVSLKKKVSFTLIVTLSRKMKNTEKQKEGKNLYFYPF